MSSERHRTESGRDAHLRVARARSHPIRAQIYRVLKQEPSSPSEMARRLCSHLSNISYHVRVLQSLGLIEVVSRDPVRGTIKTTYRAVPEQELYGAPGGAFAAELDELADDIELAGDLAAIIERAKDALRAGTLSARPDRQVATVEVQLDEPGWTEVIEAGREFLSRVTAAEQKAAERSARGRHDRLAAVVSLLSYETPR